MADEGNDRVQELDLPSGAAVTDRVVSGPRDIEFEPDGDYYVASFDNSNVTKFSPSGVEQAVIGSNGAGDGQFIGANGVVVVGARLYVTDSNNHRVQEFHARCDGRQVTVDLASGDTPTIGIDVIQGTNHADTVNGLAGADTFCGLDGNDTFNGGSGNDRAFGGAGNDTLRGDGGADVLDGGGANDHLLGGNGGDVLLGRFGNDLLEGGDNNDSLNGGPNTDTCRGQGGTGDAGVSCESRTGIP